MSEIPNPADKPGASPLEENKDARQWAMFAHLAGPASILLGLGLVGLGFFGPLIIWLMKREDYSFVDDQGKEALNFSITLIIGYLIAIAITVMTCGTLFLVLFVPAIVQVIFGIIGAVKANGGEYYRYPFNLRLIK